MAFPKKIKKYLPLTPTKTLLERREEMVDEIMDGGTYLPKSVLHADLDRGMLDFVKDQLQTTVDGKNVPNIDRIITNQNWSQFVNSWDFQDLDKNISLPFITTVRMPEVKYGTNPSTKYNIPDRREFLYAAVPTWDGQRKGVDVYKIPQPVPVDISYNVKFFANRMREINEFNKIIMQKFTSRQAYTQIKGNYIPIILEDVSDESAKDLEKRKYYISNYKFLMQGILIDEEEFQVSPAVTRQVSMFEVDFKTKARYAKGDPKRPNFFDLNINFITGQTQLSEVFRYTADLKVNSTDNVDSYSVYINNNYVGDDFSPIQVTDHDLVRFEVVKIDNNQAAFINTTAYLQ